MKKDCIFTGLLILFTTILFFNSSYANAEIENPQWQLELRKLESGIKSKIGRVSKENASLKKKLKLFNKQIIRLQSEKQGLTIRIKSLKSVGLQAKKLKGEVKDLKQRFASLEGEKTDLNEKLTKIVSERDDVINKLKEGKKSLTVKNSALAKNVADLEGERTAVNDKIEGLKSKDSALAKSLDGLGEVHRTALGVIESLNNQLNKSQSAYKELKLSLSKEVELNKKSNGQIIRLQSEKQGLTNRMKSGLQAKKLEGGVKDLKQRLVSLEGEKTNLVELNKKFNEQVIQLKKKLEESSVLFSGRHEFPTDFKSKEEIYKGLGYLYSLIGSLDEAIEFYNKSLKVNPENKTVHYNLGYLYVQKGEYAKAADSYEKALQGNSLDKDTYYNLAVIYSKYLKDDTKADEYYDKVMQNRE